MFGFLNINKPDGMTSHDVVSALRRITKIKQIGHTGTLDPMAQGVLPIAIGKATRLIEYLSEDKGYIAELELGKISDTYDKEGNVEFFSGKKVTNDEFLEAINVSSNNCVVNINQGTLSLSNITDDNDIVLSIDDIRLCPKNKIFLVLNGEIEIKYNDDILVKQSNYTNQEMLLTFSSLNMSNTLTITFKAENAANSYIGCFLIKGV